MSKKLILQVYLNSYENATGSNNPSKNNFKWVREIDAMPINDSGSQQISLAPGETRTLFNNTRTLAQDNTTEYSIALKQFSTTTYVLSAVSGTLPNFRTPRTTGADATTQVTVTLNGPTATFTSTAGTNFNLSGAQVGDQVVVGNLFNVANQGVWKIIALTATSFTIENEGAVAEGPITLGSGFATQVQIFSAAGVQVGDTLDINAGFSPATRGTYQISAVYANSLEFVSIPVLPQESSITTEVAIYWDAKSFVYLEADQTTSVTINGSDDASIKPFVINNKTKPGIFMRTDTIFELTITNTSLNTANLFLAFVG